LDIVSVFGDREYAEGEVPDDLNGDDGEWYGCRAWRDLERYDPDDGEPVGFAYQFHDDHDTPDGWGRHLWLYTEEWGSPERVAHLVQKFLRQFRPKECWSLTYATTCSKARVGEFGGGAVFVTADQAVWQDAYDFVETQREAFLKRQQAEDQGALLVKQAEESGLRPEDLDELVHDAAGAVAASINNEGLAAQFAYLIEQGGLADTQKALDDLTRGGKNDGQMAQSEP
jgi:predicted transcriptional regulator